MPSADRSRRGGPRPGNRRNRPGGQYNKQPVSNRSAKENQCATPR